MEGWGVEGWRLKCLDLFRVLGFYMMYERGGLSWAGLFFILFSLYKINIIHITL